MVFFCTDTLALSSGRSVNEAAQVVGAPKSERAVIPFF
ncbi:hypothetical protein SAM_1671 [Streptococcus agalactiae CJB111]|nr:hypothetical protein SAM_1671 [Streptococcus agalactiae CJB111]